MRLVITGAWGQLGRSLQDALDGHDLLLVDLPEHDVSDERTISVIAAFEPDLVIHTAAMTDVDGCEENPDAAFKVNATGTRNVVLACQRCGAAMLHISTDYVFDGTKSEPYVEDDEPNPISVYGRSKMAGEQSVQEMLHRFCIVRTAWLYSHTGRNFVQKMLELAEERDELSVVTTEVGSPTYAPDLAQAIVRLIQHPLPAQGIYHLVNEGACSRYEFVGRILELAGKGDYSLEPAQTYDRSAKVPANAALRNVRAAGQLGITLRPWEEALRAYFVERNREGHS